jgi:CBS domain-containing protein
MAFRKTSGRSPGPPPEVLADITDVLEACPAFLGVSREQLARLASAAEIDYLAGERDPLTPAFVALRGAVYLRDADGHTVDVVAQGEYAAPSAGERVAPVESGLVVWLPESSKDLAWSLPADELPRRLVQPDRPLVDLQLAPVRTLMRSPVLTAEPHETCREVARRMSEHRVSSVMLWMDGAIGIATDRDLRTRLVAEGRSPDTPVGEIATVPARTIEADTSIFEVLVEMVSLGIHHVPILESGRLVGMVSSGDLNQLGAKSPLHVRVAVDRADDIDGVAAARHGLPDMVDSLLLAGMASVDIGRVVATVTDRIQRRVFALLREELGQAPTTYGWVAFGSQARREQTLLSDQDHGLVLPDGLDDEAGAWWADYAEHAVDALERCGYPRCRGGVMASNPRWRHTESGWLQDFRFLITQPTERHVMESAIAFDLRTVDGELMAREMMRPVLRTAQSSQLFLGHLARTTVRHRPPLGFLGRFAVKRSGEHTGSFDVKAGAMMPIADLARLATLARGGPEVGTDARLEAAASAGQLSEDLAETLRAGYELAMRLRLHRHVDQWRRGETLDNWLDPDELDAVDRSRLRETFKAVRTAQENLTVRYQTDMLG